MRDPTGLAYLLARAADAIAENVRPVRYRNELTSLRRAGGRRIERMRLELLFQEQPPDRQCCK
jgi:hypothetical protein